MFKNKEIEELKKELLKLNPVYEKSKKEVGEAIEKYRDWGNNVDHSIYPSDQYQQDRLFFYLQKRDLENDLTLLGLEIDRKEERLKNLRREIKTNAIIIFLTIVLAIETFPLIYFGICHLNEFKKIVELLSK